jgi:hypothetical protein
MGRSYRTVEKTCVECDAKFQAVVSEVNRGHGLFCGIPCRNRQAARNRGKMMEKAFEDNVRKGDGCWTWIGLLDNDGYGRAKITHNGKRLQGRAHRISWLIHNGPIPDGMHVLHACDQTSCVRPGHLFLGTIADNNADRDAKGRQARGERCSLTKYTAELVQKLRQEYVPRKMSCTKLAAKYGLSASNVETIIRRRTWKHLPEAPKETT